MKLLDTLYLPPVLKNMNFSCVRLVQTLAYSLPLVTTLPFIWLYRTHLIDCSAFIKTVSTFDWILYKMKVNHEVGEPATNHKSYFFVLSWTI